MYCFALSLYTQYQTGIVKNHSIYADIAFAKMAGKTSFINAVAVIVCTYVYSVHGLEDSYYMEDYCTGNVPNLFVGENGAKLYSQRGSKYQRNWNCAVTFSTSVGQVLVLSSQMIELEGSNDCIKVIDGLHTSLPSVTHCESYRLGYITTQRYLTIQMTTDSAIHKSGFRLRVTTHNNTDAATYYMEDYCTGGSNNLRVGENGVNLYSQRGTTYRNNLVCTLTFYTDIKQVIILRSQSIEMEDQTDCIKLNDARFSSYTPDVSHCSNELLLFMTSKRYLTIQMTTSSSTNSAGFHLGLASTNNGADTYYMEDYCSRSGMVHVGLDDEVKLYSQRALAYEANLNCTLTFYCDVGQAINLQSLLIDLHYTHSDCIKLFDGQFTFEPSVTHCDNRQLAYVTSQRYLTIQMTSDGSINYYDDGFLLNVTAYDITNTYYMEDYCSGTDQVHVGLDDEVKLYSQRALTYQANLDCTLTFYTDVGQVIIFRTLMIDLGYGSDRIKLFDGQDTSQPSNKSTRSPVAFITSQRYLTIQMTTDSSDNHWDGFLFNVTAYDNTDRFSVIPCFSGNRQYQCRSGSDCYSDYNKCNSYPNCEDESDELNCDHCDDDSFLCVSSHRCIPEYEVCNNQDDCPNGEDEDLPDCYPTIWMYWTGGQIAGLIIGYVIFLVIVIAIVVVVNKKCKK